MSAAALRAATSPPPMITIARSRTSSSIGYFGGYFGRIDGSRFYRSLARFPTSGNRRLAVSIQEVNMMPSVAAVGEARSGLLRDVIEQLRPPRAKQSHRPLDRDTLVTLAVAEIDSLHRMAMRLARNPDAAADLVQETFVRALRPTVRFRLGERGIRPWLLKILHNIFFCQCEQRRHDPFPLMDDDFADRRASLPRREVVGDDLASMNWELVDDRLKTAVDALPVEQRLVLLLWAVEGMKYREIADLMGVPMGTIMSRLFRAREAMMHKLKPLTR
jgi:RNA polymerase sigma-70 factor (ECF subfamily)